MSRLQLSCLPSVQVVVDDRPVTAFRSVNERALLVYLAVEHERPHPRETLAGLLWPDAPETVARRNLNQTLLNLRAALGDRDAARPLVLATRQTIQLNPADIWVDVAAIVAHLAVTEAHPHPNAIGCAACMGRLREAVGHYRGSFLREFARVGSDLFEEWALLKREWLERQIVAALEQLADYYLECGDGGLAERYARHRIDLDPLDEAAHRRLMRILAAAGQRSAALLQYNTCQRLLAAELGVEPDVETRALYERISAEDVTLPTRDVAAPRHNLPSPLSAFVGRETELAELAALRAQADVRLLTLIGAGGMGKTRLALEFARASLGAYADGVFFVPLASLATAAELPSAIAQALDLALHGDPATALLRFLRTKQLLLILDNFEHLLDGAELVLALLQEAPQLQIIATSRARLNLRGEQIYLVQGLHYAAEARQGAAVSSAAVRLFAQAGRRSQPGFQVGEANLPAVLRICQLVHGMPLGLELAAAWIEMLSLDEIASEIEASADFLAADWLDAPSRQRSMRAVFDWSWRLLSEGEQRVMCQLSVFRGGFRREAAEQVAGASLRVLTTLVHKSLLRRADGSATSTGRYELHELLRQFASERLDALGDERVVVQARHSTYYLAFVAARARRLGRDQPREVAAEIQVEIDNVRQAWDWAVAEGRVTELEQAAYGWWQFCLLRGLQVEGQRMFGLAVERARNALDEASADATTHLQHQRGLSILLAIHADFHWSHIPYDHLAALAREAIGLGAASDGVEGETLGYFVLGRALQELGQHQEARAMWERSIQLARTYQQRYPSSELLHEAEWMAYIWLKGMLLFFEDYAGGRACLVEALRICQSLGKLRGEMFSLNSLATADFYMGDHAAARQGYELALPIARTLGYGWGEASTQHGLGEVLCLLGEYTLAQTMLAQAAATAHEIDIVYDEIWPSAALVRLHCQLGDAGGARAWRDQLVQSLGRGWVTPDCQAVSLRACAVYALYSGDNQQALADAERAWQISEQFDIPNFRADSAVILGHARARMHQPDLAAAAYQQAVALYIKIGNAAMISEPQAGLAQIALAQGDHVQAHTLVETLLPMLVEHPCACVHTPFYAYLVCYRVLEANRDPRSITVLQTAQQHLHECASQIADDTLRRSFLENVATHRELLQVDTGVAAIAER